MVVSFIEYEGMVVPFNSYLLIPEGRLSDLVLDNLGNLTPLWQLKKFMI
jgi:hypothetical protein